ncbi:MAG: heme o synthase [Chloroflexi bacterium]|nr:heme o synthase [Chloroflexota bacterium]
MTRFQKITAVAIAWTLALVTIGVLVRATDSGLGCPDWPLCYGQILPPLDDYKAWFEWIHRTVAAVLGLLILGVAALAIVDHRDRPSLLWPSIGAVLLVAFQAWLGRETVRLGNSGESVTAHLAAAMLLLGLLVFLFVRSRYPARFAGRGASQRFALLAAFSAASVYALLLFGSHVTATDGTLVFPDWPLMGGTLFPAITDVTSSQVLHRYVAGIVGVVVVVTAVAAWRWQRAYPVVIRLEVWAAALFLVQSTVGALQIFTQKSGWTQILHVAIGASVWALALAAAVHAHYAARADVAATDPASTAPGPGPDPIPADPVDSPPPAPAPDADAATVALAEAAHAVAIAGPVGHVEMLDTAEGPVTAATPRRWRDVVLAYVALTKPRIVELLLITTVPAMVLAAKGFPPLTLIAWTLIGGSLAAGSANAINCYIDRDIDVVMTRTRRRPLPAHQVDPANAVVFGIVLGAISFAILAYFVNLLSAFLALLAIAFYVVVYTLMLKRTTPQNIVIGGAAGALPPVIGWAAVTGRVEVPALLLFAVVFYWTPPHFWALALRISRDYAAARIPMLPVVSGVAETVRQILLYTVLLVAVSLILWAVAKMGAIYLGAAVVLGAVFLWQAIRLWREGTGAGAIRLYKYSITYLTLLFLAIAVDALVVVPIG